MGLNGQNKRKSYFWGHSSIKYNKQADPTTAGGSGGAGLELGSPICIFPCNPITQEGVLYANMPTGLTDTEIIARVLKGEQQVFSQLVERYQNYVFTLVQRLVDGREDAEEVAQDIFVKAYRSLADFRGASKFSTWLYTIVRTSCITFLRKKKLETTSLDNEKVFIQVENQESGFRANKVEQKSRQAMVNEAIGMLSPDDAQVITLFYKGEQSLEEIGNIMGMEPNTIKVKLHRARQRLKDKMEKHFSHEVRELQDD
jgi:RNA polymerase sigma factor (sigma-70 family)